MGVTCLQDHKGKDECVGLQFFIFYIPFKRKVGEEALRVLQAYEPMSLPTFPYVPNDHMHAS